MQTIALPVKYFLCYNVYKNFPNYLFKSLNFKE